MSLSNSVTTLLIDPRSHSNSRTEYRLDNDYYASTLKLVDVGLIAAHNAGGAAANSGALIYPQINGVYQCIKNIYLYSGTTLLDSVQNVAQYSAIQALKTSNQGSTDLNRDLILNGMGFSQHPVGNSNIAAADQQIARPQSLTTSSRASKDFSILVANNGAHTIPPNNQTTVGADQDAQSGCISLSSLLQFLKTVSILPRIPNLRLVVEWDTNFNNYFNANANAAGAISVIRPTLVAEKIENMPEEAPELNVPYMSTIVERFNIKQAFGGQATTNLANNPLAFTQNSSIMTITIPTDLDLRVDEPITLANSAAILRGNQGFGNNPITTAAGAGNTDPITVTLANHNLVAGDQVTFAGLVDIDGITAAQLNAQHVVLATGLTANAFEVANPAAGGATAGGQTGGGNGGSCQKDTPEYTGADIAGTYLVNTVAQNGLSCTVDLADQGLAAMPNIPEGTVAAAGGNAPVTLQTRVSRDTISRSSFKSQAFTSKFVRELVFFNHFPQQLAAAGDRYVTAQTRSPAQLNEALQLVVNNVNHLPDQGISSEAMRVMYLNSAQSNMNIPYIAMLENSGDQREAARVNAAAPNRVQFIYPYGALKNEFSITAAKIGQRVDDLRIEHQRTYGSKDGSRLGYTLLCFGTVARTLSMKNGEVRVSY